MSDSKETKTIKMPKSDELPPEWLIEACSKVFKLIYKGDKPEPAWSSMNKVELDTWYTGMTDHIDRVISRGTP